MKKKTFFLLFISILTMIYSCKKDKETVTPITPIPITYSDFSQLKAGNYWIYQRFDIDSSGNATPQNIYDSCYVEKDTIINNKTYFKMIKPSPFSVNPYYSFLRDSLHYIVNLNGQKIFSSQDFQSILVTGYQIAGTDTISKYMGNMTDKNLSVVTPAGSFITSSFKLVFDIYPDYVSTTNKLVMYTRYTENIGVVVETLPTFLSRPKNIERRLVRYHLN